MFIQTQETPNPNALKFLPGSEISPISPVFLNNLDEALEKSELAVKIFQIGEIDAVFYGKDFITVTKTENSIWSLLKPEILMVIMDHLVSGMEIFNQPQKALKDIDISDMSDIEKQIIEIIETRVRPSVAMDGGDIIYQGFSNGIVYLKLRGACAGCPSSSVTLKNGIESMLQHFIPEVKSVEAFEE